MRSTRNQPWCWQEKKVLRLLRSKYQGAELAKYRNLYLTLTEIDSDFCGKEITYYTRTIATYSGLSADWIPKALRELEAIGVVKLEGGRDKNGHFVARELVFTPESVPGKPGIGEPVPGETGTSEESSLSEESLRTEEEDKDTSVAAKPPAVVPPSPSTDEEAVKKELDVWFQGKQPDGRFVNYPKERTALKRLVHEAFARAPDNPPKWLHEILAAFYEKKTHGRAEFWKSRPFTPSSVMCVLDQVLPDQLEAQKTEELLAVLRREGLIK